MSTDPSGLLNIPEFLQAVREETDRLEAELSEAFAGRAEETPYEARRIKGRRRATKAEMEARRYMLRALAYKHGPCSVRHLFYRAVVSGVPGITKDERGYIKVQRAMLTLRREGVVPYALVVDNTRWMRGPNTYDGPSDAVRAAAQLYRRNLWADNPHRLEVWAESDSIAGTIYPTTDRWAVPLMVTRGQSSETFAYEAAEAYREDERQPTVLYVGDLDPAGVEIEEQLRIKLEDFSDRYIDFDRIAVTWDDVERYDLPGTRPKKEFRHPMAVEAEALEPRILIERLDKAIEAYFDPHQLRVLEVAEEEERQLLMSLADRLAAA